ncbi:TatD DNase family protein [Tahibacter aquaticus]|uniref:TatD DNase family protein n=1 Tax=Tahibacter aquaticus TaxID=520092 RepID=A0A4R6YKD0_9GAMM|nr:TatD family hydrolase [Tahibacter aquaticus]TDR37351.1 TatD DNase family protein [Tahibacter aquaticus]
MDALFDNLVDSHCHLDAPEFDADRAEVIARARAAGVTTQVIPAIRAADWPALAQLCAGDSGLLPAYGLHPLFLAEHRPEHLEQLRARLRQGDAVGVGECGLDYFVDGLEPELQRLFFRGQLDIAREFDLPLIVHARRAVEEVIHSLRAAGGLRGVVHSYSGSIEQAEQLWKMGFFIGIGGPLSYSRAHRLRRLVTQMPLEFLLLESDAPDQPLAEQRGQRNEPASVAAVLDVVAALRAEPREQIAAAIRDNARQLFGRRAKPLFPQPLR